MCLDLNSILITTNCLYFYSHLNNLLYCLKNTFDIHFTCEYFLLKKMFVYSTTFLCNSQNKTNYWGCKREVAQIQVWLYLKCKKLFSPVWSMSSRAPRVFHVAMASVWILLTFSRAAVLSLSFTLYSSCAKVPLLSPRYSLKSSSKARTKLFFFFDWFTTQNDTGRFLRLSVEFLKCVWPCLPGQHVSAAAAWLQAESWTEELFTLPTSLLHPCGTFSTDVQQERRLSQHSGGCWCLTHLCGSWDGTYSKPRDKESVYSLLIWNSWPQSVEEKAAESLTHCFISPVQLTFFYHDSCFMVLL